MKIRRFAAFALLFPLDCAIGQGPGGAHEVSSPLTWTDLVERPELWPRRCKVLVKYEYPSDTISLDEAYVVVDVGAENVEVVLPSGNTGNVPFAATDALDVANRAFEQMSPAQRAFDLKTLVARADLWPNKVTLMKTVTTGTGVQERKYEMGSELSLGTFDGKWVKARHPAFDSTPSLRIHTTDLVERVRAVLEDARRPVVHRVLEEVEDKVVSLRTGKKARVNPKNPPDFVLLYFSAGWCGPCHNFSPSLVSFYERNKKQAGKRFEVIWISRDRSEAAMQEYAKELKFPWLAVAWDKLGEIPISQAHDTAGIPDLVMLDSKGALIADSYVGGVYQGADSVLKVLAERMSATR